MPTESAAMFPRYGIRSDTFWKALCHVTRRVNTTGKTVSIIETGTTRERNCYSDGNSTVLFDWYVSQFEYGKVLSVDIDKKSCALASEMTSSRVRVVCADSVNFLSTLSASELADVDLLYLDSFDVDWNAPHASSLHHLFELAAVYRHLSPGCLIMVDDNAEGRGKGTYVRQFMEKVGAKMLFDSYQIGFIVPG